MNNQFSKNYIIRIETKDKGDNFRLLELPGEVREVDEDLFSVRVTSQVNINEYFGDHLESNLLAELSSNGELNFDIKTTLIELDLTLSDVFTREFGDNYNVWVYLDEQWSNFDGLGENEDWEEEEEEEKYEENYQGLGGIEMGDPFDEELAETFYTVEVLYATDRQKTNSNSPNKVFNGNRGKTNLETGVCKVSIPKDHELGNIERPNWWKRIFSENPENPENHVSIIDLKPTSHDEFRVLLTSKISSSKESDAFIFIHGYNVSFADAIKRTAQIAYDLSFAGAAITYSWPSKATLNGYMADEDSVMWTVPHLKEFIKLILSDSKLKRCHLIAHSMGNRALTLSLKELKLEGVDLEKLNQVILAAPDIDSQVFSEVIFPGVKGIGQQITLYASSKDMALQTSRRLRSDILRAGESGENIVIIEGIDTVDASQVDTNFLGHGYFAETKELITDLHMIINLYLAPAQRMLRNITRPPKGSYWQFPA